jgi:hypothetical protein
VLAASPAQACIYICRCMKHARNPYLQDGRPYVSYYDGRGRIVRKLDDVERVRSFLEQTRPDQEENVEKLQCTMFIHMCNFHGARA